MCSVEDSIRRLLPSVAQEGVQDVGRGLRAKTIRMSGQVGPAQLNYFIYHV